MARAEAERAPGIRGVALRKRFVRLEEIRAAIARRGPGLAVGDWIRRKELRMGAKGKARYPAARKLAECVWRLFRHGECFDPARAFGGRRDRAA